MAAHRASRRPAGHESAKRIGEIKHMKSRGAEEVAKVFEAIGRQTVTMPVQDETEGKPGTSPNGP